MTFQINSCLRGNESRERIVSPGFAPSQGYFLIAMLIMPLVAELP
jgi:hypothetical protein